MVSTAIAIIPARGGSKRIPRKNIIDFNGKPMIAWTIEAALESCRFERVLVSTDEPEVAQVARDFGAEAPFLRAQHADDESPSSLATIAAFQQASEFWGEEYETVVQLMPNCPLRGRCEIDAAFDAFDRSGANFQISCLKFGWMNPWWAATLDLEGRPTRLFEDDLTRRSQDLPTLYCPTGAVWLAKATPLLESRTFYGPHHRFEPMNWMAALDIDDYEDLDMAKAVSNMRRMQGSDCG